MGGNAVSKALNGEEGRGAAARSVDECAITEAGPTRALGSPLAS